MGVRACVCEARQKYTAHQKPACGCSSELEKKARFLDGRRTAEAKRLHFIFLPVFKLLYPSFNMFLLNVPSPAGRGLELYMIPGERASEYAMKSVRFQVLVMSQRHRRLASASERGPLKGSRGPAAPRLQPSLPCGPGSPSEVGEPEELNPDEMIEVQ